MNELTEPRDSTPTEVVSPTGGAGATSTGRHVLPEHLTMLLDESGLPDEVIGERGYWSAMTVAEVRRLGFSERQCNVPALVVPLWDVDGEQSGYQLRPNTPRVGANGRTLKYETPRNSVVMIDVPPRCQAQLKDPAVTLWVTEGSKNADALAARGVCAISLSGVWNWRGSNDSGGKLALADWDSIALNGRQVRLIFDSDATTKRQVALALKRLAAFLERRKAKVEVVSLPDMVSWAKQGIDDYFASGGTLEQLEDYVTSKVVVPAATDEDDLPKIVVNNCHLPELVDECWQVLVARNDTSPFVFRRGGGGALVRVDHDGDRAVLRELSDEDVRFVLERLARFVAIGPAAAGAPLKPSRLPLDAIRDMRIAWNKPVPKIRGVIRTPIFSHDGRLSVVQGYQPQTQLFYEAAGGEVPDVPLKPSSADLDRARATIEEWLHDFPFVDRPSRANVIAIPLTYMVREMVGKTPLFVIDAPTQGTGKGLLAETAGLIMEGVSPGVTTEARDGDEWRKRITAQLREGAGVILIDNVKRRLDSAELAAVLTSSEWSDRVLGVSETVRAPNRAVWMTTGNNIQIDGEISRRSVWVRLDAKSDRPWEGRTYRHPDLPAWVHQERGGLVWAFLVMVQNWLALGRPAWRDQALGSFEEWSRVVGGVLQAAGITGFLANRQELYLKTDAETEEWRDLVSMWAEAFGTTPVRAGEIARLVINNELLQSLMAKERGEPSAHSFKSRLGKAIKARADRRIGPWFIRCLGRDAHHKANVFALEAAEGAEGGPAEEAEVPQQLEQFADSTAEGAEGAESNFIPRARDSFPADVVPVGASAIEDGAEEHTPQAPHPPQSDSKAGVFAAERPAERPISSDETPHCDSCGKTMSVVRKSTTCGDCQRFGR